VAAPGRLRPARSRRGNESGRLLKRRLIIKFNIYSCLKKPSAVRNEENRYFYSWAAVSYTLLRQEDQQAQ
jgi:hypothetical protein